MQEKGVHRRASHGQPERMQDPKSGVNTAENYEHAFPNDSEIGAGGLGICVGYLHMRIPNKHLL